MKRIALTLLLASTIIAMADSNPSTWTSDSKKRHMWRQEDCGGQGCVDGPYVEAANRIKGGNGELPYDVYALAYGKTETPEMKAAYQSEVSRRP